MAKANIVLLLEEYLVEMKELVEDNVQADQAERKMVDMEKRMSQVHMAMVKVPGHQMYHNTSSVVSLDGSRVKPVRNRFFGWKEENGKGSVTRDNPLPPPPKPKPKPKPQPRPVTFHPSFITIPGQHSPGHTPASPPVPPPPTESQPPSQSKDKQLMHQFSAHTVDHSSTTDDQTFDSNLAVSDSHTETDTKASVSTTQAHISSPSKKSSNGPWFTFDDLPSHKWCDRLNEMSAWVDLQMLRPGATTQSVLREFATRFTGALRDWFDSLGNYRQLQFVQLPEVSSALAVIHDQFLGDPSAVFEVARRDYLNMKCCSLNAKDLDFHYKRMSLLFYKLNGFNEPTLKHVFLASLPDELQPDIQRQLTASNLSLDNISLGKIFQLAKTCLDKPCEQKQFFKELLKDKEPFRSACKKLYLQIKCKKKKDCDCSPKKKRHFKKFKNPNHSSRPRRSRKPYRFFQKKSSSSRDFKRRKSSRCFICKKKGHYAKDCPNKREKSIRHGIMLSAKKSTIATDNIEFLGMIIKDGHYQPGKHIAQELLHFPDKQLSKKQVQQFLGIINYIRDFIPHVDYYTYHLSALLKKKPQEWNADHTNTVTTLKQIAQNPPPLKLITDGKRILQTDASDDSWGAILLEEINGKEHFIGYASGQFSNTQKHYHSVFKEILADPHPNLPMLTRPLNPPKLTKPLKHHQGQDTEEIVLIPLAVVPTVSIQSSPRSFSQNPTVTLAPMKPKAHPKTIT
ncbi:hypothetical protein KPL70_017298 [Citrus sinensis]|nr:hypothetical protein KPL70_017298 [Citrus sinensis]